MRSADKPAVAPVEMALAGSGVARGPDVWFVGDTDIDMTCAVNAGCYTVLLRDRAAGERMNLPSATAALPMCRIAQGWPISWRNSEFPKRAEL